MGSGIEVSNYPKAHESFAMQCVSRECRKRKRKMKVGSSKEHPGEIFTLAHFGTFDLAGSRFELKHKTVFKDT